MRGIVADDDDDFVSEILKRFQFPEDDGAADVDFVSGGVYAVLDAELLLAIESVFEMIFDDYGVDVALEEVFYVFFLCGHDLFLYVLYCILTVL